MYDTVKNKQDIINKIKEYGLSFDNTYKKNHESFPLICDSVSINGICIRNVRNIKFVENTLWLDEKVSFEVDEIQRFHISFTSIRYENENLSIQAIEKENFTLKE